VVTDLKKNLQALKDNCAKLTSTGLSASSLSNPTSPESDAAFRRMFKGLWGDTATIVLSGATVDDKQGIITLTRRNTPFLDILVPGLQKDDGPDIAVASVSCTLTAEFSITDEGEIQVKLSFLASSPQTGFKTIFPNLPYAFEANNNGRPNAPKDVPPVLYGQPLANVCLVFSTHDIASESLHTGLNIQAEWTPAKLTPAQGADLELRGQIVLPDSLKPTPPLANGALPWEEKDQSLPPGIHLRAGLKQPHPLWGDYAFDKPGFRFYSPLTRNWLLHNWGYEPRMAYTGTVALGEKASGEGALVARTWDDFASEVMLVCSFENASLDSPSDALKLGAELLSAAAPSFDAVPKEVSTARLTLDRAFVRLVKGSPQSVGVTLGMPPAKWTILQDQFEVALTKIGIVIVNETSGPRIWGALTGKMKVWDAELEATIETPELNLIPVLG
jgi:hypothetical protein